MPEVKINCGTQLLHMKQLTMVVCIQSCLVASSHIIPSYYTCCTFTKMLEPRTKGFGSQINRSVKTLRLAENN